MGTKEGNVADAWLRLKKAKSQWGLADDGDVVQSHSSLLQPVVYAGRSAMLKIPFSVEDRRGCLLMMCYQGMGAAQVWEHDENGLLMGRAVGPRSLKQMALDGNDDEASRIICGVTAQLHAVKCTNMNEFIPLNDWFRALRHAADLHGGIFNTCNHVADELLTNPIDEVILHGDIHHDNILDAGERGWVAIDPKGLVGERGFDIANVFCNPDNKTATSPGRLLRQVKIISEAAGLEPSRLLKWIAAWAGLSAAFGLEDGEDPATALSVAQIAMKELDNYLG